MTNAQQYTFRAACNSPPDMHLHHYSKVQKCIGFYVVTEGSVTVAGYAFFVPGVSEVLNIVELVNLCVSII